MNVLALKTSFLKGLVASSESRYENHRRLKIKRLSVALR